MGVFILLVGWLLRVTGNFAAPAAQLRIVRHHYAMNCYYHHSSTAVGICRACGRALCPDCAGGSERGLACKGRCEDEVRKITGAIAASSRGLAGISVFFFVTGLLFIAWGVLATHTFDFTAGLGVCFIVAGVFLFIRGRVR